MGEAGDTAAVAAMAAEAAGVTGAVGAMGDAAAVVLVVGEDPGVGPGVGRVDLPEASEGDQVSVAGAEGGTRGLCSNLRTTGINDASVLAFMMMLQLLSTALEGKQAWLLRGKGCLRNVVTSSESLDLMLGQS